MTNAFAVRAALATGGVVAGTAATVGIGMFGKEQPKEELFYDPYHTNEPQMFSDTDVAGIAAGSALAAGSGFALMASTTRRSGLPEAVALSGHMGGFVAGLFGTIAAGLAVGELIQR